MCGIAGVLHFGRTNVSDEQLAKMSSSIVHRGPDDEGVYKDEDIALCFRRLSILDLEHGHQPMTNYDRSIWVVFNGEIYNHMELRRELIARGHKFHTDHSDTEVFVNGWAEWGTELFGKLNGMFACGIWDKRKRTLCLARDRYGIKPLYFSTIKNGGLAFGSEVRALHASGLVEKAPDHNGVLEYLSVQNNWRERTPFKNVRLVKNGGYLLADAAGFSEHKFWDYKFSRDRKSPLPEVVDEHRSYLGAAVKSQLMADVPVSSYLSGGIDSSAITALARQSSQSVQSYSCVFNLDQVGEDRIFDEREYSRAVADHIQATRHEFEVSPEDLPKTLEAVISALEYPMMGMSYVNYLIAGRVAEDVKVVLSGMGGDEIHGGYLGRYQALPTNRDLMSRLKHKIHGDSIFKRGKDRNLDRYRAILNPWLNDQTKSNGVTPDFLALADGYSVEREIDSYFLESEFDNYWDLIMGVDAKTYLHGLLVLEDKLSMAHSLETRVPLLDNNLVDFVSTLPWQHLNDRQAGKIVFRESVKGLVPENVYKKPKMGFGPPDASWYRNQLQSWIAKKLSSWIIKRRGVLNDEFVQQTLRDHFSGKANNIYWIWTFLSFETWCDVHGFYGGRLADPVG